jgi:hypothetical protein
MGKRRTGKEADVVLSDGEDGEVHQVAQLRLHLADPAQITHCFPVLRICDVFMRIRIRRSVPLAYGSGPSSRSGSIPQCLF